MSADQMNEIRKLFCERMKVEKIDEAKSLKDFGLDSLDVVEMCYAVEEEAGIRFETEELSSFFTVGDLFDSIEKKIAAKK